MRGTVAQDCFPWQGNGTLLLAGQGFFAHADCPTMSSMLRRGVYLYRVSRHSLYSTHLDKQASHVLLD